ncbi:MAG: TonB family protein [Bacteroidia bacterium]|nr:TonB family protein [Bacteroidia bacterium]
MASTRYTENRFDEYLQEIKSREKVSNRRRLLKIGIIMAILATGFILFQQYSQGATKGKWFTISHDQLNKERVSEILMDEDAGFVVTHHLLGLDTIKSIADYQRFRELVKLIEVTEEEKVPENEIFAANATPQDFTQIKESAKIDRGSLKMTEDATLKPFAIRMNGNSYAGEKIKFTVVNYDPNVKYTIDFGNGVTRRIGRSTVYSYPLKGTHIIRLIASSKTKGSSVYAKRISILPPLDQAIASSKGLKESKRISSPNDGLDLNQINKVTAFTVPRSSSKPTEKQVKEEKKVDGGYNPPNKSADDEISVIDLGKLKNKESEAATNKPEAVVDRPLVYAEKMPSFPGGLKSLNSYLKKHIRYPSEAIKAKTQGQVIVQFVIETDGSISAPKILKGIGSGCDEEALRIVNQMPNWVPGESNGLRVPVYQSIPITFKLF